MGNIRLISDDELYHFNPFHDKLGRFSSGNSGGTSLRKVSRYQYSDGSFTKAGKRKFTHKDGSLNQKGKRLLQRQSEKKKDEDVAFRGALTDKELLDKNSRLEQEKRLRELTENELHSGRKIVKGVLKNVGTKVVTDVATKALTGASLYAIEKGGTKEFKTSELRKAMAKGLNNDKNTYSKKDIDKMISELKNGLKTKQNNKK